MNFSFSLLPGTLATACQHQLPARSILQADASCGLAPFSALLKATKICTVGFFFARRKTVWKRKKRESFKGLEKGLGETEEKEEKISKVEREGRRAWRRKSRSCVFVEGPVRDLDSYLKLSSHFGRLWCMPHFIKWKSSYNSVNFSSFIYLLHGSVAIFYCIKVY